METTETELEPTPHQEPVMVLSQEAQYYLQQAGKWASFIAILGFIGCGLLLIVAIFAGSLISLMTKVSPYPNPVLAAMGPAIGVIYFVIALIMFFINLNLYQFATRVKSGIAYIDSTLVTSSLGKLKSFFKIKGIILIVVVSIYALIFIGVIIAGIGAATMMH